MSRAYRITVKESVAREIRGCDEIGTCLELLEILPPEEMAALLREELKKAGFSEEEKKMVRKDGPITVTIDPEEAEVVVRSEITETVVQEGKRDATGYDDLMKEGNLRDRVAEQLKRDLEAKLDKSEERVHNEASEALEKQLDELQPELGKIVNKVTREALKRKAGRMGTIKEIAEDETTGSLTVKIEV